MNRRNHLPDGWRQPPETTAEPVPLRRPYIPPDMFPPADPAPRPPRFLARRPAAPGHPRAATEPPPPGRPPAMRQWRPMRAIIGDEIRAPVLWCEFGACIARYTSPDALGERELRARALAAGWCFDALGRLACPRCARHDPAFQGRPPGPASQYPRR